MTSFTPIIKEFVIDRIMNSRIAPRFNLKGFFLIWLAAVWAVLGSAFLLYACYLTLQSHYQNDVAAFVASMTALGLSAAIALIGLKIMKMPGQKVHQAHNSNEIANVVGELFDTIGDELEEPIRDNPKTALMVASLAGFLAGNHAQ